MAFRFFLKTFLHIQILQEHSYLLYLAYFFKMLNEVSTTLQMSFNNTYFLGSSFALLLHRSKIRYGPNAHRKVYVEQHMSWADKKVINEPWHTERVVPPVSQGFRGSVLSSVFRRTVLGSPALYFHSEFQGCRLQWQHLLKNQTIVTLFPHRTSPKKLYFNVIWNVWHDLDKIVIASLEMI